MTTPYLPCSEINDFLMAYLDGDLPADRRAAFDRHLSVCPSCVDYLKSYQRTIHLGRDALASPADEARVPEGLLRAILAARSPAQPHGPAGAPGSGPDR